MTRGGAGASSTGSCRWREEKRGTAASEAARRYVHSGRAPFGWDGNATQGGQEGDCGDEQPEPVGGTHAAEFREQAGERVADADSDGGSNRNLGDSGCRPILGEMVPGYAHR
jgi:hypothetical protein